jgi:hypothetical protein
VDEDDVNSLGVVEKVDERYDRVLLAAENQQNCEAKMGY